MQTIFPDPTIAGLRITDYGALKDSWQKTWARLVCLIFRNLVTYSLKRKLMANPTQKSKEYLKSYSRAIVSALLLQLLINS